MERLPVFDPDCVISKATRIVTDRAQSPIPGKPFHVVTLKGVHRLEYDLRA